MHVAGTIAYRDAGCFFISLAIPALCNAQAAPPVIPGASGFGLQTPAGRGGTVIRVTTLAGSGAGSLRTGQKEQVLTIGHGLRRLIDAPFSHPCPRANPAVRFLEHWRSSALRGAERGMGIPQMA